MKRSEEKRRQRSVNTSKTEPQLPRALFSTGFDHIATQWHKNPKAPDGLPPAVKMALVLQTLRASEALIIAPKVSFKVYGENVVICYLIDTFGVAGVEQLLEEGAIEFILWRGEVLKWETPLAGVYPLAPFTATDPAHSDPQASIELGLKGWSGKPWPDVERIARLAAEHTILPARTVPDEAVKAVYAAYNAGTLAVDGFNPAVPLDNITPEQRTRLSILGSNVLEGLLLFENDYDLHEASESWEALVKVCSKFSSDNRVVETVEKILSLEGLPSIPMLIRKNIITWKDVVGIRSHPATEEFRRWLWSQPDPRDTKAVARAYTAAITGKKLVDREWFKAARVTSMNVVQSIVGGGIGVAIAGVPGMFMGGAAGLVMSLADTFGLERLMRGISPRRFAEEVVRPRVAEKVTTPAEGNRMQRRAADAQKRRRK